MAKWMLGISLAFILIIVAVVLTPRGMGSAKAEPLAHAPAFDQQRAWDDLTYQVHAGYRIPGTDAHRKVHEWLVKHLAESAPVVTAQTFTHPLGGREVTMWNVIGDFPGTAKGAKGKVVLAAHWDSRPISDQDPNPAKRSLPIDGADDGASGVAVLLEVARQLKAQPVAPDVTIVLFDGEDYGPDIDNMLLGAKYYAAHLPEKKPTWGILLDMIGNKNLHLYREQNSDLYAKDVNDRIFKAAHKLGLLGSTRVVGFIDAPYKYAIEDDHIPLIQAGVPTADLIDFDYPPWHTRGDTIDKCSAQSLGIVGKIILYVLRTE